MGSSQSSKSNFHNPVESRPVKVTASIYIKTAWRMLHERHKELWWLLKQHDKSYKVEYTFADIDIDEEKNSWRNRINHCFDNKLNHFDMSDEIIDYTLKFCVQSNECKEVLKTELKRLERLSFVFCRIMQEEKKEEVKDDFTVIALRN